MCVQASDPNLPAWRRRLFEHHLTRLRVVRSMGETWKPDIINVLDLHGCNLEFFDVGAMTSLKRLNLADNNISRLGDSGIANCAQLASFDISNNAIKDKRELVYVVACVE